MNNFLGIYRGPSDRTAELVALVRDPKLVSRIAGSLLKSWRMTNDPLTDAVNAARYHALLAIFCETIQLVDDNGKEDQK